MGYQSQDGQVGFKTQASKGTYLSPGDTDTPGVFMRTKSGALGGNRELLIPDPEIGGNRDIPDAYLGPVAFSGEYEFYARMESLAVLLKGALGAVTSSAAGTDTALVGTHVIKGTDTTANLPWLSVEEAIAGDYEAFKYTDARVNTLHLECDANGYLSGTVGLVALSQTAGITKTDLSDAEVDITPLVVGSTITVSYDSTQLPAKSFSLDINNNLEDDDFRLGSVFLGDTTPKRREMTMGVTIRPEDSDLWRLATYGSASATEAQGGAAAKKALSISIQTYEVIGTSSSKYGLTVAAPKATIAPFQVSPSGDDVLQHDLEIHAFRPDPTTAAATFTVLNGQSTVA